MAETEEVRERIVTVCRKLSDEEKNILREVFGLEASTQDVCEVISKDLSKVKEQAVATQIISRVLSEAVYVDSEGKCRRKGLPMLYSPFCWNPNEIHHCFVCGEPFYPRNGQICESCDWLKCPNCGQCLCNLSEETKTAISSLFHTYCQNCCRFREKSI